MPTELSVLFGFDTHPSVLAGLASGVAELRMGIFGCRGVEFRGLGLTCRHSRDQK